MSRKGKRSGVFREPTGDLSEPLDLREETFACACRTHGRKGARHHHIASTQRSAIGEHGAREPSGGIQWMAYAILPCPGRDLLAVLQLPHAHRGQIKPGQQSWRGAQNVTAEGYVGGDVVDQLDVPIRDPTDHDFDGRSTYSVARITSA